MPRNPRPPAATDRGPDTLDVPLVDYGGQRLLRRTGLSEVMNRVELRPQSRTTTLGLAIHPDGSSYPARVISGRNPEQPAGQPRGPLHDTARLLLGALLVAVQGVEYLECAGEQRAADCYARLLAARSAGRRTKVGSVLRPEWPMVEAAYTPLVVLLVIVLVTGNLRVGIFAALGVGTMVLGGLGFFAARRAGGSRSDAVRWSLASASLGIVVILLKLVLH